MIKINDTYYELNLIDIIKELKNQLAMNNIYLFNQVKELPDNLLVTCPFHKEGQERRASCGIRKSDGWLHCFTCGESCSLEQLISRCFGVDDLGQYGTNWLKTNFLGDVLQERSVYINLDRKSFKTNSYKDYIDEKELERYRYYHPYMYERKLTNEVIDLFDIGYDKETDCLTFPIKDRNGNCLFIARRSVKGKYFNYPNSAIKPLYGVYELYQLAEFPKEIYICESMIDALTLWSCYKPAIALNGLGTRYQIEELNRLPCRKFILATDNDLAGKKSRKILKKYICNQMVTEVVLPTDRKDINECTIEEIENLQENF